MVAVYSITGARLAGPRGESPEVLRETPGGTSEKAGGAEAEGREEEERCGGETQAEAERRASKSKWVLMRFLARMEPCLKKMCSFNILKDSKMNLFPRVFAL